MFSDSQDRRADETATILEFASREAERHRESRATGIRDLARLRMVEPAALFRHLDSAVSVQRYQRKADEVAGVVGSGRLLDWGSFCGQMTFLLLRRGVGAVPFDVEENKLPHTLNDLVGRRTVYSRDLVHLPFDDESFDAVLSCGTLEHVADPTRSLQEIRRILKPAGRFFIYNLPNLLSWVEFVLQLRGNGHDRRYLLSRAERWLHSEGFSVDVSGYENVLPCSLSSVHGRLRTILFPVVDSLNVLEPWLEKTLPFRLFATNLKLFATKR